MTVKRLIEKLKTFNPEAKVYIGSDEELNSIYESVAIDVLIESEMEKEEKYVLYGLSGSEVM